MSKKVISIVLCLTLVVALAVPALAATTLYTAVNAGYRIGGTATISGTTARSTMTASAVSSSPSHPITDYSDSSVSITAYDKSGNKLGTTTNYGYPTLTANYLGFDSIYRIEVKHRFNGTTYGTYKVYA